VPAAPGEPDPHSDRPTVSVLGHVGPLGQLAGARAADGVTSCGDGFDNAVVESFWARMQTELLNRRRWRTRVELSTEIFDWIEVFYNRVRRHSSIGMQAPISFEKLHQQLSTAP
jgi:hypothetical protein